MGPNAINTINYRELINNSPEGLIRASAPCRLDMGGTLDIPSLHFALQHHDPLTVNLAIDLRTQIAIRPYTPGAIKVSSRGFEPAIFQPSAVPYQHPLGLIFAVAAYFSADGIDIHIDSPSPPKSGLGGSSVAAVALVAAFMSMVGQAEHEPYDRKGIAMIAQAIEAAINGVPCGFQDQLAATYGGIHAWHWKMEKGQTKFKRVPIMKSRKYFEFAAHILAAYTGVTHVSNDINGQWVRQFLDGTNRDRWIEIIHYVNRFSDALSNGDIIKAVDAMNSEVDLRKNLTPDVINGFGQDLVAAARKEECGARFTGAGGGGCIWAIGPADRIAGLKQVWQKMIATEPNALLMDHGIDDHGVVVG